MYNHKSNFIKIFVFIVSFFPVVTAAAGATVDSIGDLFTLLAKIVNWLIPFMVGLAVLYFLWSVLRYIGAGDNVEKRTEGAKLMVYGVISIFVMVSVWGLVNLLGGTLNLNNAMPTNLPAVPVP